MQQWFNLPESGVDVGLVETSQSERSVRVTKLVQTPKVSGGTPMHSQEVAADRRAGLRVASIAFELVLERHQGACNAR
jgi:hypothetical protein